MRKKFVQFAALLLAFCLIPLTPARAVEEDPIIRVGLYYGSSALDGANLANSVGSGFQFGYYDSSNQFFPLAYYTGSDTLSIVKTENVYYGTVDTYACYYDHLTSSTVGVGCYHLQLDGVYDDYESAQAEAEQYSDGFVAYVSGAYYVRVGNYLDRDSAATAQENLAVSGVEAAMTGTSVYGISVVLKGTNTIIFQYDDNGAGTGLGIEPIPTYEGEKCVSYFKYLQWYGGFRYERINGGDLTVVNMVPLEDYIRGILPYEMSNSWPLEALKAQAVCARSYTMTNLNRHSSYHFDVCNTTHCQVYSGTGSANTTTDRAVDETLGQYVWYDGEICQAFYHSCDGGATENSENVWTDKLPYLQGVTDPYEALVEDMIPAYSWTKTYTGKELQTLMINNGHYTSCGEVANIRVSKTTPTGNVYSVTVTDVNGTNFTISKDFVRTIFGVSSLRYTISGSNGGGEFSVAGGGTLDSVSDAWIIDGSGNLTQLEGGPVYAVTGDGTQIVTAPASSSGSDGTFVFSGTGKGHNVGMSQWGAYAMAQQGDTYEEILKFYFTGVEIY